MTSSNTSKNLWQRLLPYMCELSTVLKSFSLSLTYLNDFFQNMMSSDLQHFGSYPSHILQVLQTLP